MEGKDSFKGKVRRLLACNNKIEAELLVNALDLLQQPYIVHLPQHSINTPDSIEYYGKESINIITDHCGSRGLEFLEVVLLLNPSDHHQRHHVIEAASRCIGNLLLDCALPI